MTIPEAQRRGTPQVRLYIHRGPCLTVVAQAADGVEPPGRWMRVPVPRPAAARFWRHLPIWDELSAGVRPSHLLPTTGDGAAFSSRSRLLRLAPPDDYHAGGDRRLGESADGRPLSLSCAVPLFTVGAPPSFLAQQVVADLERGCAVVVVSPQRRTLNLIQRHCNSSSMTIPEAQRRGTSQAQATGYWLDQENSRASAHLAVVSAGEWAAHQVEPVIQLVESFLVDLGLDLHLPAVHSLVRQLVRILAASAQATGHDLTFTDLYAISQNTQILRAFLADLAGMLDDLDPETRSSIRYLTDQLEGDVGYVQVVTVLSTIRAALSPIRAGVLHALCQPPFLNVGQALSSPSLLLVPATNADFPEYDRFLATMLDLALKGVMSTAHDFRLALHLHDPHLYRHDNGRRWIEAARQDERLSLLVNVHDPDAYAQVQEYTPESHREGELVFRCSEGLASSLVGDWNLAYSIAELTEIPADTALARLPGLPGLVTLKTGSDR